MHNFRPISALGSAEASVLEIGGSKIVGNTDLSIASVAASLRQEEDCVQRLKRILGVEPPEHDQAIFTEEIQAIWMGQDQWLLIASHTLHELLSDQMKTELANTASVTEQNDAWVCFDIAGDKMEDLFERLCPVPLRRPETRAAQRTTIEHLGCFVILTQAAQSVRVLGPR